MYKLHYYVPLEAKEKTKEALFKLGVGKLNNYEKCAFETVGYGQFKPIGNAKPYIGKKGEVTSVKEYKIEMLCPANLIKRAIETLKEAHPYEEVAYEVIKLENF